MNMLLILLLSCICYHSSLASTYSSYEEAKVKAESLKKEFGYGVSTEVIIQNALSYDINFSDADHFEGYFHSKPPSTVSHVFVKVYYLSSSIHLHHLEIQLKSHYISQTFGICCRAVSPYILAHFFLYFCKKIQYLKELKIISYITPFN